MKTLGYWSGALFTLLGMALWALVIRGRACLDAMRVEA